MRVTTTVVQAQVRRAEMSLHEKRKQRKLLRELTGLHVVAKPQVKMDKLREDIRNHIKSLDNTQLQALYSKLS